MTKEKIFKIQLSSFSMQYMRQALIYDKSGEYWFECDAPQELIDSLNGESKAFWYGTITREKKINLLRPAPWQEW